MNASRALPIKITSVENKKYLTEDSLINYQAIALNSSINLNYEELIELKRFVLAGGSILYFNFDRHQPNSDNIKAITRILFGADTLNDLASTTTKLANFISVHDQTRPVGHTVFTIGLGKLYVVSDENFTSDKLAECLTELIADSSFPSYDRINLPSVPSSQKFSVITLLDRLQEPMGIKVLDNQDVLLIERTGAVFYYSERKKESKRIAQLDVNYSVKGGLNTLTLDPNFNKNRWVYFGYNAKNDSCYEYVSRYYLAEDSLILNTRKDIIKVPVWTGEQKTAGNTLEFDQVGNLIFGLGSHPWQFTSNQNLKADSSRIFYKIPLNTDRNYLNIKESQTSANHTFPQPEIVDQAENFQEINCLNSSPFGFSNSNSGIVNSLSEEAWLPTISERNKLSNLPLNTCAIYWYNPHIFSKNQFPKYYNGKFFFFDQERQQLNATTCYNGKWETEPVIDSFNIENLADMQFGPDGSLYVLDYGRFAFANNAQASLKHITYAIKNRSPVSKISADINYGAEPLSVNFNTGLSYDPDPDDSLQFVWTIEGATIVTQEPKLNYTFLKPGIYYPKVQAIDKMGSFSTDSVKITVGNAIPRITLSSVDNTSFYWKNASFSYQINVNDLEDGVWNEHDYPFSATVKLRSEPADSTIAVRYNAEYGRYYVSKTEVGNWPDSISPKGEFKFDWGMEESNANLLMEVSFQDSGSDSIPPKRISKEFLIHNPKVKAVTCDSISGAVKMAANMVRFTNPLGYICFNNIDLTGVNHITYWFKSWVPGQLSLRIGDFSGPDLSRVNISEDANSWQKLTARVGGIEGNYNLYFTFESEDSMQSSDKRFVLDWIYFGREKIGRLTNSPFNNLDIIE